MRDRKELKMSRKLVRPFASLVLALVTTFTATGPALAAPPTNDTFTGATPVIVGFNEQLDTSEATTDADDAQMNPPECGAPATDASVWYVLQGSDQGVIVDVSQSSYSAGVLVSSGSLGNFSFVTCGPGAVAFFAASGETYYVLAIDDQLNGDGLNGGNLSISFNEVTPPPMVDITVNRYGRFDSKTGIATISGTYTCTNGDFIDVFVNARQRVGRFFILGSGEFFDFGTCDGTTHTWSADVFPQNGRFGGGKALTVNFAISCGPFECGQGFVEQIVQLRGKK
jgi:hypothetical protein